MARTKEEVVKDARQHRYLSLTLTHKYVLTYILTQCNHLGAAVFSKIGLEAQTVSNSKQTAINKSS